MRPPEAEADDLPVGHLDLALDEREAEQQQGDGVGHQVEGTQRYVEGPAVEVLEEQALQVLGEAACTENGTNQRRKYSRFDCYSDRCVGLFRSENLQDSCVGPDVLA